MAHAIIRPGITYIGIQNPNLRVFDIVMETKYGTSYNSYIVQGEKATALIETAHRTYMDAYIANIKEVCDPGSIDYIVLNHCEPDHTGSLSALADLCPKAQILVSQAGSIYVKAITNRSDLNIRVVKDGDSVDLGGRTLSFISAPFLHWPDSMFTYIKEDKTLFSCDFLGAHYCEPLILDTEVRYKAAYEESLLNYYTAIFGPFKPYVLQGLTKIEGLELDTVCTSHGPVLTKNGLLDYVRAQYLSWSTPPARTHKQVPIFYCSAYGNTAKLARAIEAGLRQADPAVETGCYDFVGSDMNELAALLNGSDGFLIGSPTLNRDALPYVWQLLSHMDAINSAKRPAAVFGSYGWSGEAAGMIEERLRSLRADVRQPALRCQFTPTDEDLGKAQEWGRQFMQSLL